MLIKKPDKYVNYFGIGSIWLPTDHEIFFRLKALSDKLGLNSQLDFTTYKGLKSVVIEKLPGIYTRLIKNYIERITGLAQKLTSIEKK